MLNTQIINLVPQNYGQAYDVVPDLGAFVVRLKATDPLTTSHVNYLDGERAISGFLVVDKSGFVDVYLTRISSSVFQFTRDNLVDMTIFVF